MDVSTSDVALIIAEGYVKARHAYPAEGRRKWRLRAVADFWKLGSLDNVRQRVVQLREGQVYTGDSLEPWQDDSDEFDPVASPATSVSGDGIEEALGPSSILHSGIIVRTDFSDEEAWCKFLQVLEESEQEGWEVVKGAMESDESDSDGENEDGMEVDEPTEGDEGSNPSLNGESTSKSSSPQGFSLFRIVDSPSPSLIGASNLSILRTFVDVSIISAPQPPVSKPSSDVYMQLPKTKTAPQLPTFSWMKDNPLISVWGLREVYYNQYKKTRAWSRTETERDAQPQVIIWVYDTRSNVDGSVRLVSSGIQYGAFTGDSWRARGSHVWDLQYNLMCENISNIGFSGGQEDYDRYSWDERKRNFAEVGVQVA